jgi:flagellin-like protein
LKRPEKIRPVFPVKNPLRKLSDERGVSPVIAVILMVAITVVLSAVLYVMVMGLIGGTNETIKLSMTWEETYDEPGTYAGGIISIIGDAPDINKVRVNIRDGKTVDSIKLNDLKTVGNFTVGSITISYHDVNGDDILGAEDLFIISGVTQGDSFRLTHTSAGEIAKNIF